MGISRDGSSGLSEKLGAVLRLSVKPPDVIHKNAQTHDAIVPSGFQLSRTDHADKLCYSTKLRLQQLVPSSVHCEGTVTADTVASRNGFVQHYQHKALSGSMRG